METLIIQVDCRPYMRKGAGPPQLGIVVEDPSSQHRKQLKAAAKDFQNHDYHNLDDIQITYNERRLQSNVTESKSVAVNGNSTRQQYSRQLAATLAGRNQYPNEKPIQSGLKITQIQEGSVIDRIGQFKIGDIIVEVNGVNLQRSFTEAQRALKQFVVEHTSHAPLVLKVLREPAPSTSSIRHNGGPQTTVIERNSNGKPYEDQQLHNMQQKLTGTNFNFEQQVRDSHIVTQPTTSLDPNSPTSPKTPLTPAKTSRHLVGALNTRRIGTRHKIRLRKGPNGFGIKIAERDNMHNIKNRPVYITAITTTGSAYEDGQLKEGDMLLEVDGVDLHGKSQPEITKMLKSVNINEQVEIVVSRQDHMPDETDQVNLSESDVTGSGQRKNDTSETNDDSLIDLNDPDQDDSVFVDNSNQEFEKRIDSILNDRLVDGPGRYVYDIPNDTKSAGLGLYLKYPRRSSDHKDLGIWIVKVITGGAAWKDGRLQPDDQIQAINGISLTGLSNVQASETLTAAVCRGVGPEAAPNTIRLEIQRRDPSIVAKILLGTDSNIEHSDVLRNSCEKLYLTDGGAERDKQSSDSYKTAYDATINNISTHSNTFNDSSGSSNRNSQNDSAMSPQTQASSSLKISTSNDRQNSSDKTNETTTSSVISQITDFTSVPSSETQRQNGKLPNTIPKSLQSESQCGLPNSVEDNASSSQSYDDESLDVALTGEEAFQRDGFGRQSISEKRHAQLNAKNTDTFKRNQKAREERERQRKLEEQLARQHLNDDDDNLRHNQYLPYDVNKMRDLPATYSTSEFKSIYGLQVNSNREADIKQQGANIMDTYQPREVPVDVHMPVMATATIDPMLSQMQMRYDNGQEQIPSVYSDDCRARPMSQKSVPNLYQHQVISSSQQQNLMAKTNNRCLKCGGYESNCLCETLSQQQQHAAAMRSAYQIYGGISNPGFDHSVLKRSNSLESIQPEIQMHNNIMVPRAGTVRMARNRRVNESFRAAVDRSYEGSTNESSSRRDHSSERSDARNVSVGPSRITSSIANTTISTANDERYLIGNNHSVHNKHKSNGNSGNGHTTHKKSSSLLTKFLKFGSMKKKKKNREENPNENAYTSEKDKERQTTKKESSSRRYSNGVKVYDQHSQVNSNSTPSKTINNDYQTGKSQNFEPQQTYTSSAQANYPSQQQQISYHQQQANFIVPAPGANYVPQAQMNYVGPTAYPNFTSTGQQNYVAPPQPSRYAAPAQLHEQPFAQNLPSAQGPRNHFASHLTPVPTPAMQQQNHYHHIPQQPGYQQSSYAHRPNAFQQQNGAFHHHQQQPSYHQQTNYQAPPVGNYSTLVQSAYAPQVSTTAAPFSVSNFAQRFDQPNYQTQAAPNVDCWSPPLQPMNHQPINTQLQHNSHFASTTNNGPSSSGSTTATNGLLHNMQPQHIYYYDF